MLWIVECDRISDVVGLKAIAFLVFLGYESDRISGILGYESDRISGVFGYESDRISGVFGYESDRFY